MWSLPLASRKSSQFGALSSVRMGWRRPGAWRLVLALGLWACDDAGSSSGPNVDAFQGDGAVDAARPDARVERDAGDAAPAELDAGTPDQAVDAASPDAALGAEPCPRNAAGRCDVVGWITSRTAYPTVVDHHTTLIALDGETAWLNVFGGIQSTSLGEAEVVYDAVRRARVSGRGVVEAFEDEPPLPFPLAFHAQIVVENQVFLLGGITADAQGVGANPRYVVGQLAGGRVTGWQVGALPAEVRVHPTGVAVGQQLYLVGGTGAQGRVLDSVLTATLGPDGLPGAFAPTVPLPAPRSHHASVVVAGHILILGGFTTNQVPDPAILRSVHNAAGTLTGWEEVGTLPDTPWTSSVVVHRGWVWLVGGGEGGAVGGHFVNTVRGAPLDAEGRPGAFEVFDRPLPLARSHVHQTPVHNGFVYSVGGRVADGNALRSTNRVLVGELW